MAYYQSPNRAREEARRVGVVGKALISAVVTNDQKRLFDILSASSQNGLEYLDRFDNTPLLVASYRGRAECVRVLLQHGANYRRINSYGQNALSLATYSGSIPTCQELLRVRTYESYNKRCMMTPMCVAALQGNVEMVLFYLARDRDIPTVDSTKCKTASLHGVCPLRIAVMQGDDEVIRLLTEQHIQHI